MKILKLLSVLLIIMNTNFQAFSQTLPPPPSELRPNDENKQLINQILEVSKFEKFFKEYCKRKIEQEGTIRKWTKEEMILRFNKTDYLNFKDDLYSWFATMTKDELTNLIDIFKKINNKDNRSNFVLINTHILSNLDLYIKGYLN